MTIIISSILVIINLYQFLIIRKFSKLKLKQEIETLNEDLVLFMIQTNAIKAAINQLNAEIKLLKKTK